MQIYGCTLRCLEFWSLATAWFLWSYKRPTRTFDVLIDADPIGPALDVDFFPRGRLAA